MSKNLKPASEETGSRCPSPATCSAAPVEFHVKQSEWNRMPEKTKAALMKMVECAAKMLTNPAVYLDAECCECGWRDGIRADLWNSDGHYWCDGCNAERGFKLVLPPNGRG